MTKPNYAAIRRLELELGLRQWDERDDDYVRVLLHTQVRYVTPELVAAEIVRRRAEVGA